MVAILDKALTLWQDPVPDGEAALDRFRSVYADPLVVNGTGSTVADLADRARAMQRAFTDVSHVVHDIVEGEGFLSFAFEIRGRHVGPWPSALGLLQPSGQRFTLPGIDIFRFDEAGRVAQIWATNDQSQLIAAALSSTPESRSVPS
jgi:SnoaL-like polyketide cyclase